MAPELKRIALLAAKAILITLVPGLAILAVVAFAFPDRMAVAIFGFALMMFAGLLGAGLILYGYWKSTQDSRNR